jgi:hypothetical protein
MGFKGHKTDRGATMKKGAHDTHIQGSVKPTKSDTSGQGMTLACVVTM